MPVRGLRRNLEFHVPSQDVEWLTSGQFRSHWCSTNGLKPRMESIVKCMDHVIELAVETGRCPGVGIMKMTFPAMARPRRERLISFRPGDLLLQREAAM